MPRLLVADKIAEAGLALLRENRELKFDVRHGLSVPELAAAIGEYDGVLIRSGVSITAEVLARPGRLAVIARAGVGVDNVDLDAATRKGVLVLNTPDANTISTAEHTFAMMLALHRKLPDAHHHVLAGEWNRSAYQGQQLAGQTLGIVGFGRIGRAVARRARAFEMKILAYDPFVSQDSALDGAVRVVHDLRELLAAADCVTLHASVSDKSKPLIGAEELAAMKPGARLVNCARGALVDENALADALNTARLGGAAIDVYAHEPPAGSPLLTARNVVLTPHLGASTAQAQEQVSVEAVEAVLAYLLHGEIRSPVNVTGLPSTLTERGRAFVDLCARMGTILSVWCDRGIERLSLTTHGQALSDLCGTLAWQTLASVLAPHLDERVNLVNARDQAERRGIAVEHRAQLGRADYPEAAYAVVIAGGQRYEIKGTVLTDGRPRVFAINDYRMEMIPERSIVLIFNDDQPGVIGRVGQQCGDAGVNIADMALSRRGPTALMVLKLDEPLPEAVQATLRSQNPPIRSVHTVSLPPLLTGIDGP